MARAVACYLLCGGLNNDSIWRNFYENEQHGPNTRASFMPLRCSYGLHTERLWKWYPVE
jgi:hypothetical protein